MDNSFTLLSTMSAKIKTNRKVIRLKVPTKLALKKNLRRTSIFDGLPSTAANNSLIFVESSTTDSTNSSSSRMGVINNSSPITIHDSDSTESEKFTVLEKSTDIYSKSYKIPNNCGLSKSKFDEIKKWISNLEHENGSYSAFSSDVHPVVSKAQTAKERDDFDELISSIKRTLHLNELSSDQAASDNIDKNSLLANKDPIEPEDTPIRRISTVKPLDDVSSSSDVIENSDDEENCRSNCEITLSGGNWKTTKNIAFPYSEPRYRKTKREMNQILPKTEVKPKPKWSIVHQNPYLNSKREIQNTPFTQKKVVLEPPWTKRLQALCDSESSEQSLNKSPPKHHLHSRVRLVFDNKDNGLEKPNMKSSEKELEANAENIDLPINVGKKYFSNFSDDDNVLAKKLDSVSDHNHRNKTEALDKANTCELEEKKINKNNVGIVDLDKENFSDFAEEIESLEDRLKKKLGLQNKTIFPVSRETKIKETADNLKGILNEKCTNVEDSVSKSDVGNDTNDKPPRKTRTSKKKTTTKKKAVKKKSLTSSSDDDSSDRIVISKISDNKFSNDTTRYSNNSSKSFLASLSGSVPISQCDPSARIFRNNFKMYKTELVRKLFKLYNEKIFENAIPDDSLIEWSERMRGTAGYCYCKKIIRRTGVVERKIRIVLATKVLDCADRLRDTLIHEMCHAATWIVNEVSDGHGSYWRAWAHKARQVFPELPLIKVCHNYAITTKYTYKCTSCSYSFGRHSKSINIEKKRCGHCYGIFEILINKVTKGGETKMVPATPKKKPTGFALFVKENYAIYKTPQLSHGQVMKVLGQKFGELKISVCKNDEEEV